ncbi:MAG: hypothetical protein PWP24_274 [Clostridiales bacterium]|nr:hypothetical protein [Clostridiales bacterium]
MKALIVYFSGTGNTAYVARKIEQVMKEFGVEAVSQSIEELDELNTVNFDFLVLGCPKYYEYPVLDFIQSIEKKLVPSQRTISTMIYGTQAAYLQTDFSKLEKILRTRNYKVTVTKSFQIANNMVIFGAFPGTDSEKIKKNLKKLTEDLKPLVGDFLAGRENKEHPSFLYRKGTHLSGVVFTKLFPIFAMKYSASEACVSCGICAAKCPKGNITMQKGKPQFGKNCIFCMRCINICPQNAIQYNKKTCTQYKKL